MTLDKKSINMLLSLDDDGLAAVINQIAAKSGLQRDAIKLGHNELEGIRSALRVANEGDLSHAMELIRNSGIGNKR